MSKESLDTKNPTAHNSDLKSNDNMVQEMVPIPLGSLLIDSVPDFSLYLRHPSFPNRHVLYREGGKVFSREKVNRLNTNGIETLYITKADRDKHQRYLLREAKRVLEDKQVHSQKKASVLYEFSKSILQSTLEEPDREQLQHCKEMTACHVEYVIRDENAMANLLSVASYDYYTYTHSINVCLFTVAICRSLGIEDEEMLKVIGIGAILHDLGKARIDKSIIQKPGRLTSDEFRAVMQHPALGADIVQATNPVPLLAQKIILQHHEKCDGSGYPHGISYSELDIPSRACCLADIFDALTTKRSYKKAIKAYQAFQIMQEMKGQLDQQMLMEFVKIIGEASRGLEIPSRPESLTTEKGAASRLHQPITMEGQKQGSIV